MLALRITAHGIARFGPNCHRRGDLAHGVVGQQHFIEESFGFVPGARLKDDSAQHIRSSTGAVRLVAGPIKQAAVYQEVGGGANEADTVARRVHDTARDDRIIPVPTGNRIVAGVKLAIDNIDVMAPMSGRATKVNAVPAAGDFHISYIHVVAGLEKDGVIGSVHDGDIADAKVVAIGERDGVWSAHVFFAGRVKDLVTVDYPLPADGDIFGAVADQECPMPFSPFCLGHERGDSRRLV